MDQLFLGCLDGSYCPSPPAQYYRMYKGHHLTEQGVLEIALQTPRCCFSAGVHRDREEVVTDLLGMVLPASSHFSQSTRCGLTPAGYEVALLRHGHVSLRVEGEWIGVSPATEQLQREQVQSLPGTSSGR